MTMRWRRLAPVAVLTVLATAGAVGPAAAAPRWDIDRVVYNPPGWDIGTTEHLNLERVVITNRGNTSGNLKGYLIHDEWGHTYTFTTSTPVRPGSSVTLHTGRGNDYPGHRYWDKLFYVWNNHGIPPRCAARVGQRSTAAGGRRAAREARRADQQPELPTSLDGRSQFESHLSGAPYARKAGAYGEVRRVQASKSSSAQVLTIRSIGTPHATARSHP